MSEGLKKLRNANYPWLTETADLMEEMAEALERYERARDDGRSGYVPPKCPALEKYKEWK